MEFSPFDIKDIASGLKVDSAIVLPLSAIIHTVLGARQLQADVHILEVQGHLARGNTPSDPCR